MEDSEKFVSETWTDAAHLKRQILAIIAPSRTREICLHGGQHRTITVAIAEGDYLQFSEMEENSSGISGLIIHSVAKDPVTDKGGISSISLTGNDIDIELDGTLVSTDSIYEKSGSSVLDCTFDILTSILCLNVASYPPLKTGVMNHSYNLIIHYLFRVISSKSQARA